MKIDNSGAKTFRECPWKYYESYIRNGKGIQAIGTQSGGYGPLEFGDRMHQLQEEHYKSRDIYSLYGAHVNEALENEAVNMIMAYKNHYPDEVQNMDIVSVEQTFEVPLPDSHHVYRGKMDVVYRREDGKLNIRDHKSEKRGGKNNLPQKWAQNDQASLYLWAAERLFPGEEIGDFEVNVMTRQSPKGVIGCSFPERQVLERGARQKETAVRDIILVADDIESYVRRFGDGPWPADRTQCFTWAACEFSPLHTFGEDVELILKHKFEQKKEYLGVPELRVIQ